MKNIGSREDIQQLSTCTKYMNKDWETNPYKTTYHHTHTSCVGHIFVNRCCYYIIGTKKLFDCYDNLLGK